MLRSLFAGVSGMRTHQLNMDVIADNIANVNTAGYKSSRLTFKEVYSQLLRGARGPLGDRGGVNPLQIGLGVTVGSIDTLFVQGAPQATGRDTDISIDGNGFFILADGDRTFYTRAGMFSVDSSGFLVHVNGMKVKGWVASDGQIDATGDPVPIQLPTTGSIPARATTQAVIGGNLDSRTTATLRFDNLTLQVDADPAGGEPARTLQVAFRLTPTGNFNEWNWEAIRTDTGEVVARSTDAGKGPIVVDKDGNITAAAGALDFSFDVNTPDGDVTVQVTGPSGAWDPDNPYAFTAAPADPSHQVTPSGGAGSFRAASTPSLTVDVYDSLGRVRSLLIQFTRESNTAWQWVLQDEGRSELGTGSLSFSSAGVLLTGQRASVTVPPVGGADPLTLELDFSTLTQLAAESGPSMAFQDGYASGQLVRFTIDDSGIIKGIFSNDVLQDLAQIALAMFGNPEGLVKQSDTLFTESGNSGQALPGRPNSGNRGRLAPGFLEMSNVDLSQEFTNLILAQRGFQANSRVITTSDEMLQELMTLKR